MYLSAVAGMYTDKSWYTPDLEIKAMRLLTVTAGYLLYSLSLLFLFS